MRKKPRGAKYRNLIQRGGVIYYERLIDGKRFRRSCKTDDWNAAAELRDSYEAARALFKPSPAVTTFGEVADNYLAVGMKAKRLAPSTQDDRRKLLGVGKPIREHFGALPIDAIDATDLQLWWDDAVTSRGRAQATGINYLDAIAGVMNHAKRRGMIDRNPVDDFREKLVSDGNTKAARADQADARNPIESPERIAALVRAADEYRRVARTVETGRGKQGLRSLSGSETRHREQAYLCTLILLDAGLRLGEAMALRWEDVYLEPADEEPYIAVRQSLSRGKYLGTPKSGRTREVQLSRRLRGALVEWRAKCGTLAGGAILTIDQANYRNRAWPWIRKHAELPTTDGREHKPKDLRDTFASQLLSAGIPLPYVSTQLGHADVATTARHYGRWVSGKRYVAPPTLAAGEVPADLLARLTSGARKVSTPPTSPPTSIQRA